MTAEEGCSRLEWTRIFLRENTHKRITQGFTIEVKTKTHFFRQPKYVMVQWFVFQA